MSPLLILLVIDSLSRNIGDSLGKGIIRGVKVVGHLHVTYLMFVDDLLLGGQKNTSVWSEY